MIEPDGETPPLANDTGFLYAAGQEKDEQSGWGTS